MKKEYYAFISYRHADNTQQGRQWATWLHQALETYQIPEDLIGTKNGRGEVIPEKIYPVFRDEDELPADANLGSSIQSALAHSKILVVLCSPKAVASTYVADEIDYFKRLGHSERIIAAILDGEPNVSWDQQKQEQGFEPKQECFPKPLQLEYSTSGEPTTRRAEPIAADLRVNINGELKQGFTNSVALKTHLAQLAISSNDTEQITQQYEKQRQLMLLKIIAGILGVPLGELTQRDKAYQLQLEQQRAKRLRRWLAGVAALAIVAVGAGILAYLNQQQAIKNELLANQKQREAEQSLAQAYAGYGRSAFDEKRFADANVFFSYANELNPDSVSLLEKSTAFAEASRLVYRRPLRLHYDSVPYITPNDQFSVGISGESILLYDLKNNQERLRYPVNLDGEYIAVATNEGNKVMLLHLRNQQYRIIDTNKGTIEPFEINSDDQSLMFFPGIDDGNILVLDIAFNLHKYSIDKQRIEFSVPAKTLWEKDKSLSSDIKKSLIDGLNNIRGTNNGNDWLLYSSTGTIIKIPFNASSQSDVWINQPLVNNASSLFQLSPDGQYYAHAPQYYCLFEVEKNSKISTNWAVIADKINIYQVSSGQLIDKKSLNLPVKAVDFLESSACSEDNYTEVLSDENKSKALKINNAVNRISAIHFNTRNKIELVTDSGIISIDEKLNGEFVQNRKKETIHTDLFNKIHKWLVTKSDNAIESMTSLIISKGDFSIYPKQDSKSPYSALLLSTSDDESSENSSLNFPAESWLAQSAQLSMSHDQRFLFGITPFGRLNVYAFASGDLVKSAFLTDNLSLSSQDLLCPGGNSHEVLIASDNQLSLYNWFTGRVLYKEHFEVEGAFPIDCDFNRQSATFAIAYLNRQNPSSNREGHKVDTSLSDNRSKLILFNSEQQLSILSDDFSDRLLFPSKIKFSDDGDYLYVGSAIFNSFKIDLKQQMPVANWSKNGSSSVTDFCETASGDIATSYADGTVHLWNGTQLQKVLERPLPIIALSCSSSALYGVTGYNKNALMQDNVVTYLKQKELASEVFHYSFREQTLTIKNKFSYVAQQAWLLFAANEWLVRSRGDLLSRYQPQQQVAIQWYNAANEREKWFYFYDNSVIRVNQLVDEIVINTLSSTEKVTAILEQSFPGISMWHIDSSPDKEWVIFIAYSNQEKHQILLINTNDPTKKFDLTQGEIGFGERLALIDFSSDSGLVVCMKTYCDLIQLDELSSSSLDSARKMVLFDKPISQVVLTKNTLLTYSEAGTISLFERAELELTESLDNAQPKRVLDNAFYRYLFKVDDNTLFTSNMKQSVSLNSKDLSVVRTMKSAFKGYAPLHIDLQNNIALFIQLEVTEGKAPVILYQLEPLMELSSYFIDGSAISTSHYDGYTGHLYWTKNSGDLAYMKLPLGQKIADFTNTDNSEQLSGAELQGIDLLTRNAAYTLENRSTHSTPIYMLNNRISQLQIADAKMSDNFDDPQYWSRPIQVKSNGEGENKNLKTLVLSLEEKILRNLHSNQNPQSLIEQLKLLDENNYYVRATDSLHTLRNQPFTAYKQFDELAEELNNQPRYAMLKNLVVSNYAAAAIQSRQSVAAYQIINEHPQALINPSLATKLVFDLFNMGHYRYAKDYLLGEIEKMRSYGLEQPSHANHQMYQQSVEFYQQIKSFLDIRSQVPVPAICVGGIQKGSLFEYSGWQDLDCILQVAGRRYDTTSATWQAITDLVNQGGGEVMVMREAKRKVIAIKPPLVEGVAWRSIGYPGEYVLRIQAVTEPEQAKVYDLRKDDLLVQLDGQRLVDRSVLLHYAAKGLSGKTLYVVRPDFGPRRQQPNEEWRKVLGNHPAIYLSGELLQVKLTSDQPFGVNLAEMSILLSKRSEPVEVAK